MSNSYTLAVLLALALAASACTDKDKPVASNPAPVVTTSVIVVPAAPEPAVSTTASSPTTAASTDVTPPKINVDLLVFDKLHRECLQSIASNGLTPMECRDRAWINSQK